jgi:hypothetical protein
MTSLVAWAGVDSHGPASVYVATDSRISWGAGTTWDFGRKVFASRSRPELFGYVGDVLFPSLVLGQISDTPGPSRLSDDRFGQQRFERISGSLKATFDTLPSREKRAFRIAYAARYGEGMNAKFKFFSLGWNDPSGWHSETSEIPRVSDSLAIWGSGAKTVELWKDRWSRSSQGGTSRAIFASFCDAVASGQDSLSGGAPQLVALYRIGPARSIGIVHGGQPFIYGLAADSVDHSRDSVEWRNHLFERCEPSGDRLAAAQLHHSPKGLGGK